MQPELQSDDADDGRNRRNHDWAPASSASPGSPGLMRVPLATVPASRASRPIARPASIPAQRRGAGIDRLATLAQARRPARRAPVPSPVELVVLATTFSRDGCTPTTGDFASRLDAAVVAP